MIFYFRTGIFFFLLISKVFCQGHSLASFGELESEVVRLTSATQMHTNETWNDSHTKKFANMSAV